MIAGHTSNHVNIMKLMYRLTVLFFIINMFAIAYFFTVPERFNEIYEWYHGHQQQNQQTKQIKTSEQITIEPPLLKKKNSSNQVHQIHKQLEKDWDSFIKKNEKHLENKQEQIIILPRKKQYLRRPDSSGIYRDTIELEFADDLIRKKYGNKTKSSSSAKIILIFTYLHKSQYWYNLPLRETKDYLKRKKCKLTNCEVTYNKDLYPYADVVIFHERNLPSSALLEVMNKRRPKGQRWVFFTSETPLNSESGIIPYNGLFNWTMTYKVTSDIYLPYLQYRKLNKKDKLKLPKNKINYAKGKKYATAWLVSNCNFGFRMEYAHLLEQSHEIHVGGNCRDDFKKHLNCTRFCPVDTLEEYKFFLSFENGVCTDYVSEKYWKYLELGLVPVVLGGANYSDPRIAIPGSFIDATKFKSIKELGEYLDYVHANDEEYNKYFEWKRKYKIWHPIEGDWPFESYFLCKICKMLNRKNIPKKVYYHLNDFWSPHEDCEIPEARLKKKYIPENYSWEHSLKKADELRRLEQAQINKDFDDVFHDKNAEEEFS